MIKKMKNIAIVLILAVTISGCNNLVGLNDECEEPQSDNYIWGNPKCPEFCLGNYLNINRFLDNLSDDLSREQALQELVTWLKSQPCVYDVKTKFYWTKSDVLITLKNDVGLTHNIILTVSLEKPMRLDDMRHDFRFWQLYWDFPSPERIPKSWGMCWRPISFVEGVLAFLNNDNVFVIKGEALEAY